jgi:hypothetical protein
MSINLKFDNNKIYQKKKRKKKEKEKEKTNINENLSELFVSHFS